MSTNVKNSPRRFLVWLPLAVALVAGCAVSQSPSGSTAEAEASPKEHGKPKYVITEADTAGLSKAIFAGGCFWCEETAFEGVPGVHSVISGYDGGKESDPTYEDVSAGLTGHAESVLVTFDPKVISYQDLLHIFWVNHDPTTADRQFCDRGHQYRPAIFYLDDEQKREAEASVKWALAHAHFKDEIVTEITPATPFWPAEEYHQDFYKKDPVRYHAYRLGCGRDARLEQLWGKMAAAKH